jgi:hypothetical protein
LLECHDGSRPERLIQPSESRSGVYSSGWPDFVDGNDLDLLPDQSNLAHRCQQRVLAGGIELTGRQVNGLTINLHDVVDPPRRFTELQPSRIYIREALRSLREA